MLGFSDAKIAVVKRGAEEVVAQGLLADHIGEKVCPRIIRFIGDGYEMELLHPPVTRDADALKIVYEILLREVWPRRSWNRYYRDDTGWRQPLLQWSMKVPWITAAIHEIYPAEPVDGYCLVHGDPALSNLMQRANRELVITDPMPRLAYRTEIPSRKEVDHGKLVQSAMGWERMLGEPFGTTMWNQVEAILSLLPIAEIKPAMLWGAVHLARVGLRARDRQNRRIESWAFGASRSLVDWIKEYSC